MSGGAVPACLGSFLEGCGGEGWQAWDLCSDGHEEGGGPGAWTPVFFRRRVGLGVRARGVWETRCLGSLRWECSWWVGAAGGLGSLGIEWGLGVRAGGLDIWVSHSPNPAAVARGDAVGGCQAIGRGGGADSSGE